jgi:alpha-methylacyl-CoA racemase
MGEFYQELNQSKRYVPLNLKNSDDQRKFAELVREADGLIEGFRPEAKKKLGLDAATLLALNPRLCVTSLTGYPETGPWKDRAGHDLNFQAVTGMLSLQQGMPGLPWADFLGAYAAATRLCAMLDHSARTGNGGRIEVSLARTLQETQGILWADYQATGIVPRHGEILFSGRYPCYRLYRARCGRAVAVGAIEPKFWTRVCELLDVPDMAFEAYAEGEAAERAIAKVQQAWESRSWEEWREIFEGSDCCVEPVLDFSELNAFGLQS